MKDDGGQALVFAVVLLGLAAFVLIGLRAVSDRILEDVLDDRAGEAAVAAAASAVADLKAARERYMGHEMDASGTAAFAAEDSVIAAARETAVRLSRLHGRADPSGVRVLTFGMEIEVHLTLAGRKHVALLEPLP